MPTSQDIAQDENPNRLCKITIPRTISGGSICLALTILVNIGIGKLTGDISSEATFWLGCGASFLGGVGCTTGVVSFCSERKQKDQAEQRPVAPRRSGTFNTRQPSTGNTTSSQRNPDDERQQLLAKGKR